MQATHGCLHIYLPIYRQLWAWLLCSFLLPCPPFLTRGSCTRQRSLSSHPRCQQEQWTLQGRLLAGISLRRSCNSFNPYRTTTMPGPGPSSSEPSSSRRSSHRQETDGFAVLTFGKQILVLPGHFDPTRHSSHLHKSFRITLFRLRGLCYSAVLSISTRACPRLGLLLRCRLRNVRETHPRHIDTKAAHTQLNYLTSAGCTTPSTESTANKPSRTGTRRSKSCTITEQMPSQASSKHSCSPQRFD